MDCAKAAMVGNPDESRRIRDAGVRTLLVAGAKGTRYGLIGLLWPPLCAGASNILLPKGMTQKTAQQYPKLMSAVASGLLQERVHSEDGAAEKNYTRM